MTMKILKLSVPAHQAFVLYRYWLKFICGYTEIQADNGLGANTWPDGAAGELASHNDGVTTANAPYTLTSAFGAFNSATMIGKYLVTCNSAYSANNDIWRIIAIPNVYTVIVANANNGHKFAAGSNISWLVLDPSVALLGNAYTVMQAPSPSGTSPAWQVQLSSHVGDATLIRFTVAPLGLWNTVLHVFPIATDELTWTQDPALPSWYLCADTTHFFGWTDNVAGNAAYNCIYAGSANTFRTSFDSNFALAASGLPNMLSTGMFGSFKSLDTTGGSMGLHTILKPASTGAPDPNLMLGLPNSPFDLRRDVVSIPVCTASGVTAPVANLRGVLRSFHFCSSTIGYKSFVNNNRSLISLGLGLCVSWDGNLVV